MRVFPVSIIVDIWLIFMRKEVKQGRHYNRDDLTITREEGDDHFPQVGGIRKAFSGRLL